MTSFKNQETYGEPQRVSAIAAAGKFLAKPKSATLKIGIPIG